MAAAIFWSGLASSTLLIGLFLAYRNLVSNRWIGLLLAFGAGAMVFAASIQLIFGPLVENSGHGVLVTVGVAAGALTYYFSDKWVDRRGGADRMDVDGAQASGSGTGILLGSLLDGVPESLVLGISLVSSPQISLAFIFAVAIGNIPQGLGSAAGMMKSGWSKASITRLNLLVCALSVAAAMLGYIVAGSTTGATGTIFDAFAGGALLVMLSDSMIPEAFQHAGKETGLALVLGFGTALAIGVLQGAP